MPLEVFLTAVINKRLDEEAVLSRRNARADKRVQKGMRKAKDDRIDTLCKKSETCIYKNKQQESISAGEGSNLEKTGLIHNYAGQIRENFNV